MHHHWGPGGGAVLHDTREDEGGLQWRRGRRRGRGRLLQRGIPQLRLPGRGDGVAADTEGLSCEFVNLIFPHEDDQYLPISFLNVNTSCFLTYL